MTNEMNNASAEAQTALAAQPTRANGIVNLTQYSFELVGAIDLLPESPQRDEVLKQAKALRLDLATATRESLFDGFISLEGLRERLLAPREIKRDDHGWLTHPTLPACDEDVRGDKFLEAFGIESAFVSMESDVDAESYEQYHERADADCSAWTPTPPDGDGWVLLEIYDTEDGPYALFAREKRRETMRERRKRDTQKPESAAIPTGARKETPMSQLANSPLSKALVSFDSLPNSAHVDVRTVAGLYGCSVPTVWRRVAAGLIPAAKKFGHSSRWNVAELRAAFGETQ